MCVEINDKTGSVTIEFNEYNFVLHRYPVKVKISNEDYELLKNKKISLSDIVDEYNDLEYGCSEPLHDDTYLHGYEVNDEFIKIKMEVA